MIDLLCYHPVGFIYSDQERQVLMRALGHVHYFVMKRPTLSLRLDFESYDWCWIVAYLQYRLKSPKLRECIWFEEEGPVLGNLESVQVEMHELLARAKFSFKMPNGGNKSFRLSVRSSED